MKNGVSSIELCLYLSMIFWLAKKQQNCSNPTAVVLTMVLSFTMHLKGTGHYGFVWQLDSFVCDNRNEVVQHSMHTVAICENYWGQITHTVILEYFNIKE